MPNTLISAVSKVVKEDNEVRIRLDIPVNEQHVIQDARGDAHLATINSITMLVIPGDWTDTLNVNWDASPFEDKKEDFSLLMHNPFSDDDVTRIMLAIYRHGAFTEQLKEILLDNGFSEQATNGICGSEWGMQSSGQATYDAHTVANELCLAHHLEVMPE